MRRAQNPQLGSQRIGRGDNQVSLKEKEARWGLDPTELGAIWIVTHFTDVSFVNVPVSDKKPILCGL